MTDDRINEPIAVVSVSGGKDRQETANRAIEAKALGHTAADIETLKFVEERNREEADAE